MRAPHKDAASDSEMEGGDEVGRLGDDVVELVGRQLLVVVDVRLEQHLKFDSSNSSWILGRDSVLHTQ